ncbi:MAG: hypothetical protein HUU55_08115 [Myxococcales bacterium]|nr:hypothetical protein [Myxococcales bacterium]
MQVDATDYIKKCKPGTQRCNGSLVEECASNGKSYEIIQICAQTEQCIDAVCTTGGLPGADSIGSLADTPTNADLTGPPPQTIPTTPTPTKLGNLVNIAATLTIDQSLVGGFVDIGLCSGSTASYPADLDATCRGSLFFRVKHEKTGLTGTFYRHESNMAPKKLSEPLFLDPNDVFLFEFKDYASETGNGSEIVMTGSIIAVFSSVGAAVTETLPFSDVAVFGLWNYNDKGDDEEALSGELAGLSVSIAKGEPVTTDEFFSLANEVGDVVTSPPMADVIGFYFSAAEQGAMFYALR